MTLDAKSHCSDDVLEQYSFGHLFGTECERVEDHLLTCEQCQQALITSEAFITDMKSVCNLQWAPASRRKSLLARWLTAAPRPAFVVAMTAVVLAIGIRLMPVAPTGPPLAIKLSVMRGPEWAAMATAEKHRPLQLHINSADLPNRSEYRIEIVNQFGAPVWAGELRQREGYLVVDVTKSLTDGTYWVRLFASDVDDLVREFGLFVK